MTIYFNPFQDGSVFIGGGDIGLGTSCLGPEAFLRDLELRSGRTCAETGSMKRVIEYRNALRKELEKHLLRTSGMGDKWKEIIASATLDYEGNTLDADKLSEIRLFTNMWENTVGGKVRKSNLLTTTGVPRRG